MAVGNEVVAAGLNWLAGVVQAAATVPKYLQWGTGTTTPGTGDTDMQTPGAHEARTSGTPTNSTNTFVVTGTITCLTSNKAITEFGQFTTAGSSTPPTGGTMWAHAVHDVINVTVGSGIAYTSTTTFTDNS